MEHTQLGHTDRRYVGVWDFDASHMAAFERTRKLDTLQPPYELFRPDAEQAIFPYCIQHGISVLIYGPPADGLLSGKYSAEVVFPATDWRSKSELFRGETLRRDVEHIKREAVAVGGPSPESV
jgi:aryl-alcohol dehydrogenase-like predicted oxidoreductase